MDHAEFRELLTLAKDFKVTYFKKGDIEVHFQMEYAPIQGAPLTPAFQSAELDNKPDPDEEMLKKIEEMKNQSLGAQTF